ncbi:MAG: acyltransferase [Bacteroidales bacterium]|jgi:acetyltransferase-like isoleucine patch superfamily enzyme|nr:acyltransferase [Bacteroidales bacterium]HOU30617.1 acyltransferase [Bacteroidales bacterium]HPM01798.1 acyltransferase [Candidatus Cloacimonadota bacterium]HQK71810.1 acyltransferase [Bacteroidales bacterium]
MSVKQKFLQFRLALLRKASNQRKISYFRKQGVRIGENCFINTVAFSTEPYLIEIGNHVAIAGGTEFLTHDGAIWCLREEIENADVFGRIKIGNNVFIGNNCIILPNTVIGDNSVIGAGSVVRGQFPENSVIIGNPAKTVMSMSMQKLLYTQNPGFLKIKNLSDAEKKKVIKKHFNLE